MNSNKSKYHWLNHFLSFLSVILGVYLAFYINEKAKENEHKKESIILMQSLINDLSEDIKMYEDYHIPKNKQSLENIGSLINILIEKKYNSLESPLSNVLELENSAPNTATYSSIKSSGKIGLIENPNIRKDIASFYEGIATESQLKGQYQAEYLMDEIIEWIVHNADLLDDGLRPESDLQVFRNKLIIFSSLLENKITSYEMIVEESKTLIEKIEAYIDTIE